MPVDFPRVRQCLNDFDFRRLFTQELGWDHHRSTVEVTVEGQSFTLAAVAEKRGMVGRDEGCRHRFAEGDPRLFLARPTPGGRTGRGVDARGPGCFLPRQADAA
ncbi:MAG: hypothetical protein GX575_31645 [Candidatus Anammoximicrobium sp.]|nr:hypothetical protein [Candidatus Anammoximicrobium sp.]